MPNIREVDVVFPTRNRLVEVLTTLEKIKAIGLMEDQIFIGDDFSDLSLSTTIKKKFEGVTIISNTAQHGQLFTRNLLFKKTNRKYILSIDDDSHIVSREALEQALEILTKNDRAGIFGFRAFQQLVDPPPRNELDNNQYEARTFIACGALIKRECVEKIGNYTRQELGYYCEEIDCSIRAFMKGYAVITKNDLVVHHRVNRNYKDMPKKSDATTGVYGSEWRSVMGFSDNLIVTLIYFPYGVDFIFLIIYIWKRFFLFTVKNSDYAAFFKGLYRTIKFIPYIFREKRPMSYTKFFEWIRLPMM